MRRKRAGAVRLSDHAYERWGLRVGGNAKRTSVAARIRRRIAVELKLGAEVRNGALEIEVGQDMGYLLPQLYGRLGSSDNNSERWKTWKESEVWRKEAEAAIKEEYKNTQEILLGQAE